MTIKLLQLELHNRRQNLLFYGIAPRPHKDIYALVTEEIAKLLNILMEIAGNIPINNAHRLPTRKATHDTERSNHPDPIIVCFARMSDITLSL